MVDISSDRLESIDTKLKVAKSQIIRTGPWFCNTC